METYGSATIYLVLYGSTELACRVLRLVCLLRQFSGIRVRSVDAKASPGRGESPRLVGELLLLAGLLFKAGRSHCATP